MYTPTRNYNTIFHLPLPGFYVYVEIYKMWGPQFPACQGNAMRGTQRQGLG
jgi:hypothetical protein